MEAVVKFNIIDDREDEWIFDEYASCKFENLTDEDLTYMIASIISSAIVDNRVYYDCDDADNATQEILPVISSIILNPRFRYIRMNYNLLVELVTYLTVRLA